MWHVVWWFGTRPGDGRPARFEAPSLQEALDRIDVLLGPRIGGAVIDWKDL